MTSGRAALWGLCAAAALLSCASGGQGGGLHSRRDVPDKLQRDGRRDDGGEAASRSNGTTVNIDDAPLGARYELPALEEGWAPLREGRGSRRAGGVQVDVGSFPLSREATPSACRDSARGKLGQEKPSDSKAGIREQTIGDWPTATWSFTRGTEEAPVRSRWAFFPRGSDCLLLEVSGPRDDRFADVAFQTAARTFKVMPLPPDRQREVDLLAGMSFLERRDPGSALERFEVLSNREPGFAKAHFGALMAGFELGPNAYTRALPHGLAALHAERELSAEQRQLALRAVGVMQLAENQPKSAAVTLSELVVRAPDLAEGRYNYACALARMGDKDAALDHLKAAMRLDADLVKHAKEDDDLKALRGDRRFEKLLREPPPVADPSARKRSEAAPEQQPAEDDEE